MISKKADSKRVIHLHFHRKRTGVTRSIESLIPALKGITEASVFGYGTSLPHMGLKMFLQAVYNRKALIIHAHRNNEVLFALLLRLLAGRFKLVFTRHSATPPSGLTIWLMRRCDAVISLTREAVDSLPLKSFVAGHGVDTSLFNINSTRSIDETVEDNIISVVGRIRSAKGQLVVMKAVAELLYENPSWGILFIGRIDNRKYAASIASLAKEQGVYQQIGFVSETDNIARYYNASRLVITGSFSEGFSLVCLEAIACGVPVIATKDVGIHNEVIKDGVNGALFNAGDHIALKELVAGYIDGSRLIDREQIRNTVTGKWDTLTAAEKINSIYDQIA